MGEEDFIETKDGCQEPKRCTDEGCIGETIIPLDKIMEDVPDLFKPAPSLEK